VAVSQYLCLMAVIRFQLQMPAAVPSVAAVSKNMVMAMVMAKSVSPIETATKQHTIIFWVYIGLLVLTAIFTFLVWWSGNKVQDAIRADADARIAEATQRAAEANRTAEQERLARIRIEERLAGWRLEPEAEARLIDKLKPYKVPFALWVNPVEFRFMHIIDRVLRQAGWTWHQPPISNPVFNILLDGKAAITYHSGITIELAQERWSDFGPAANALIQSLNAEGIAAKLNVVTAGAGDPTTLHVVIGNRE
jgi:hypothetical protein